MKFEMYGKITIDIDNIEVDAENQEEALKKVKEILNNMYHLDVHGAYHNPNDGVKIEMDFYFYEEGE